MSIQVLCLFFFKLDHLVLRLFAAIERAGQWFCSQDYLLKGTQLTKLLEHGQVQLTEISLADVANYERIMMVNALNPFDERRALPISVIQF